MNACSNQQLDTLRQMADIPYFGKRRCGFQCDNQQIDLFRRASARTILNCSRQTGKSTAAALKAVHTAYFQPDATILVTAPSKNQTREFLRKVRNLAIVAGLATRGDKFTVTLKNGSRIVGVAANEDTIRCYSAIALVIIDEASRVKDDVYYAILPMLATSMGGIWLLSTPKGKRGFFHAEWASPPSSNRSESWVRLKVKAADCPRISTEFLTAQKRRLGERRFAQEYECYFVDLAQGLFNPDVVRRAFTADVLPFEF